MPVKGDDMADYTASAVAEHLGESAVYTPPGGAAQPVVGVFDRDYVQEDDGTVTVDLARHTFSVKTADITSPARGGVLVYKGTTYKVTRSRDDGEGMTTLVLEI